MGHPAAVVSVFVTVTPALAALRVKARQAVGVAGSGVAVFIEVGLMVLAGAIVIRVVSVHSFVILVNTLPLITQQTGACLHISRYLRI